MTIEQVDFTEWDLRNERRSEGRCRKNDIRSSRKRKRRRKGVKMGAASSTVAMQDPSSRQVYDEPTQTRHLAANWPPSYRWLASSCCYPGLSESNHIHHATYTHAPQPWPPLHWNAERNLQLALFAIDRHRFTIDSSKIFVCYPFAISQPTSVATGKRGGPFMPCTRARLFEKRKKKEEERRKNRASRLCRNRL